MHFFIQNCVKIIARISFGEGIYMKAICVDDEEMILDLTVSFLEESGFFDEVKGFSLGSEAIEYMDKNDVAIALLDVDMP